MTYIDKINGETFTTDDGDIVWMNEYDVANAVGSWDGGEEPSTYEYAISPSQVEAANIQILDGDRLPNLSPFLFDGETYWELEESE